MSNPLEDLLSLIRKHSTPFVGFTFRDGRDFYTAKEHNTYHGAFGKTEILPIYWVSNQPNQITKWSSREVMMRYVRRKDDEFYEQRTK